MYCNWARFISPFMYYHLARFPNSFYIQVLLPVHVLPLVQVSTSFLCTAIRSGFHFLSMYCHWVNFQFLLRIFPLGQLSTSCLSTATGSGFHFLFMYCHWIRVPLPVYILPLGQTYTFCLCTITRSSLHFLFMFKPG